jgi:phage head maturation protease
VTEFALPEIELRSSTLQDVNTKQRLVDLIAVPWEQEADVLWRGDMWHEVFDRHAFDGIQDHAGRVPVNRQHTKGDTVGKVVQFDPSHRNGLFARVKIANTPRGDETLALAEEGMAFPSVGYRVKGFSDMRVDRRSKSRRILRAFMDHLAMVEDPTWAGAEVLAVRAESSGLAVVEGPLPETPALDELLSDPVFAWAASRVDKHD